MSQARVTDFFATRKRSRFNQDEVLLNKQKKTQSLEDAPPSAQSNAEAAAAEKLQLIKSKLAEITQERSLRSRTKQQQQQQQLPPANESKDNKEKENKKEKESKKEKELTPSPPSPPAAPIVQQAAAISTPEPVAVASAPELDAAQQQEAAAAAVVTEPPKKKMSAKKKVNMAELKRKIADFNQNLQAIQNDVSPTPALAVPRPAADKVAPPTVDENNNNVPAYLKFEDLASDQLDLTSTLTLPKCYSMLFDAFKGSDTIVKFMFNRDELCTFLKLRLGIQNLTKHTFGTRQLAQIKHIYPAAYLFRQEKLFVDFKNDYHLIVSPNLDELELNAESGLKQFTPRALLSRLAVFKKTLFDVVRQYHKKFLESLGMSDVPLDKIRRWHQKFDLEKVPDIDESDLPKPPVDASIKCKTGQELLSIARDIYSARIQNAITSSAAEAAAAKESSAVVDLSSSVGTATNAAAELKRTIDSIEIKIEMAPSAKVLNKAAPSAIAAGSTKQADERVLDKKQATYNALLEKVRNKEKQKAFESMVINSDKEKLIGKYTNMKEIVRFLMFYFQAEKKSTLEFDKVAQKLADNMKGKYNELECRELLKEMTNGAGAEANQSECLFVDSKTNKKWLTMLKVRNLFYLQMDKSVQLNDLYAICDKQVEALQQKAN